MSCTLRLTHHILTTASAALTSAPGSRCSAPLSVPSAEKAQFSTYKIPMRSPFYPNTLSYWGQTIYTLDTVVSLHLQTLAFAQFQILFQKSFISLFEHIELQAGDSSKSLHLLRECISPSVTAKNRSFIVAKPVLYVMFPPILFSS